MPLILTDCKTGRWVPVQSEQAARQVARHKGWVDYETHPDHRTEKENDDG